MSRRHAQRHESKHMTCTNCKAGNCLDCVDITRARAGYDDPLCECRRKSHNIEPSTQQILDPETQEVHAPGLTVKQSGIVEFLHPRCGKCHFRHASNEECITL